MSGKKLKYLEYDPPTTTILCIEKVYLPKSAVVNLVFGL